MEEHGYSSPDNRYKNLFTINLYSIPFTYKILLKNVNQLH